MGDVSVRARVLKKLIEAGADVSEVVEGEEVMDVK